MSKNEKRVIILEASFWAMFSVTLIVLSSQAEVVNLELIIAAWISLFTLRLFENKQHVLIAKNEKMAKNKKAEEYNNGRNVVLAVLVGFLGSIITFFFTGLTELRVFVFFVTFFGTGYIQKSRFLNKIDQI